MNKKYNDDYLNKLRAESRNDYFKSQSEYFDMLKLFQKKVGYVFILILFLILSSIIFFSSEIKKGKSEDYRVIQTNFKNDILKIIKNNYKLLNFNNNIAIIKMEDLYLGTYEIKYGLDFFDSKNEHLCLGYFVIYKTKNNYEINTSHYCDMFE